MLNILKKFSKIKITNNLALKLFSVFLSIYLIFNSSVIYKIANDPPYFGYLDKNVDFPRWNNGEITSGYWVKDYKNINPIYGDSNGILLFLGIIGQRISPYNFWVDWDDNIIRPSILKNGSYFFLRDWNIKHRCIMAYYPTHVDITYLSFNHPQLIKVFLNSDKIYSSDYAEYYYIKGDIKWKN